MAVVAQPSPVPENGYFISCNAIVVTYCGVNGVAAENSAYAVRLHKLSDNEALFGSAHPGVASQRVNSAWRTAATDDGK